MLWLQEQTEKKYTKVVAMIKIIKIIRGCFYQVLYNTDITTV